MGHIYDKLFNEDIKEKFLSTMPADSAKTIRYAFYKSFDIEDTLNKDLFNFTPHEIREVLKNSNCKTKMSVTSLLSNITSYIRWAIKEGYVNSGITPDKFITPDEYETFIDKSKVLYLSKNEIEEIIGKTVNSQDKLIVHFAFYYGLDIDDLIDLHYYDVNWQTGVLKLKNRDYATMQLEDKSLAILESAYHETTYHSGNGVDKNEDDGRGGGSEKPLVRSDYILRNTFFHRTKNIHGIEKHTVYKRLSTLREFFELDHFTLKSIKKSGMIYEGYKLFMQHGKLETEQINDIAKKYNINPITVKGYTYYNVTILTSFINRENILDLYGVDIEETE